MSKELPSPELLRKLLRYEPDTGKLYWRERTLDMFVDKKQGAKHNSAQWNCKYAEKDALACVDQRGYKRGKIFGRVYLAHRVIWAMYYGEWPDYIDHINGVRDDNSISNLRSVTALENSRNAKRRYDNVSGVCGVGWLSDRKKWYARIKVDGKNKHLGCFTNFECAVAARKDAETKYGFHKNHGRQT